MNLSILRTPIHSSGGAEWLLNGHPSEGVGHSSTSTQRFGTAVMMRNKRRDTRCQRVKAAAFSSFHVDGQCCEGWTRAEIWPSPLDERMAPFDLINKRRRGSVTCQLLDSMKAKTFFLGPRARVDVLSNEVPPRRNGASVLVSSIKVPPRQS